MKKAIAFSAFKILHIALLAGQLFVQMGLFYLASQKTMFPALVVNEKLLQIVAIVFAAFAVFAGTTLFKKKLIIIKELPNISAKEKFAKYRSACIIQWALLEGAGLFCGICFFLTGNYAFLGLAFVLILLFAMQAPGKTKMALQLDLSIAEVEQL